MILVWIEPVHSNHFLTCLELEVTTPITEQSPAALLKDRNAFFLPCCNLQLGSLFVFVKQLFQQLLTPLRSKSTKATATSTKYYTVTIIKVTKRPFLCWLVMTNLISQLSVKQIHHDMHTGHVKLFIALWTFSEIKGCRWKEHTSPAAWLITIKPIRKDSTCLSAVLCMSSVNLATSILSGTWH